MTTNDLGAYPEKYPTGSIFWSEGKRLYDLVIEHKPKKIIEVGTRWGASTQFLALGCLHNGFGEVHTYDIENLYKGHAIELNPFIFFHHHSYFEEPNKECDLLFEDGAHTNGFTSQVLKETKAKVIAVHDFMHWDCVQTVKNESIKVLGKPNEIFIESPSDCGLAIWYK
jgi:hypothetical protein